MLRYSLVFGVALAIVVPTASAEEPTPIKLTLTPAKPPTPALRYQLLPDARITTSGDAAPLYKQAIALLKKTSYNENGRRFDTWIELPLDKLPKDEMRKVLAEYASVYEQLDKAARCDHCDWGFLARLREKGKEALVFPELLPLRQCANLLLLQARLDLAEGHFDTMIVSLRNGFALARHTEEREPFLTFLMAITIAVGMQQQLDAFIDQPNAPNLYYALTDLPVPLLSMRQALEIERAYAYSLFPGLSEVAGNLDSGNLTAKQLEACVKSLEDLDEKKYTAADRKKLAQAIQEKHEIAKNALIAAGRPRNKVEAMPHLQVALLHSFLEYDTALDEMLLCNQLPYGEAAERFERLTKRFTEDRQKDPNVPAIPMLTTLIVNVGKFTFARVRTDRKIALLRTIEAIRFHAATHDGQLPPSLPSIKEVPIPLDPVTGKNFEYQRNGDVATLRGPATDKEPPTVLNSVVYELRIRK